LPVVWWREWKKGWIELKKYLRCAACVFCGGMPTTRHAILVDLDSLHMLHGKGAVQTADT
jgi:hypothetical protein